LSRTRISLRYPLDRKMGNTEMNITFPLTKYMVQSQISYSVGQDTPCFYEARTSITRFTKGRHCILSRANFIKPHLHVSGLQDQFQYYPRAYARSTKRFLCP
jgi:hypothetical protein